LVPTGKNQVEIIAEGKGPLIVMLPSASRGADDFYDVAALIAAQGFRVVCPEPRGSGRTTGPHEGISLHDVANDVAAAIQHENIGPAILVGHAAGSFTARMTAVDHPELVRGVVLAAAGARSFPPELGVAVEKMHDPAISKEERLKYLRLAFFSPGNDATSWLTGWKPLMRFGSGRGAPAERDSWWGAGNKPVLEIQALDDPFKPRSALGEYKAEFGDRVTVVQIPNASHALFPEQPRAVADAIVKWARTISAPSQ
jgi:pimeloyl-ACP methyl ester carboxylesterase